MLYTDLPILIININYIIYYNAINKIHRKITQFWLVKINAIFSNSVEKRVNSMQRSNKPDWTIPWTV